MQPNKKRLLTSADRKRKVWYETRIHHLDSGQYSAEIGFVVDEAFKSLTVPASMMTEHAILKKELLNAGADIDQVDEKILAALKSATPVNRVQLTKLCGWVDNDTFVQPTWTLGKRAASLKANCSLEPRDSRLGSFAEWRKGLTLPCEASSYLSFAIGIAFAAPLLKVMGENEGATFNYHGKSSHGKTLASRAALSTSVRVNKNEIPTYKITDQGLEELCLARNDLLIVIDEQGRAGKGEAGRERIRDVAFTVAGGQGKIRCEYATKAMQVNTASWRAMGLTSGEHPLEELSSKRDPGEQVRHVDIPISSNRGIFDRVKSLESPITTAELAAQIETVIASNYGCALKEYMKLVLDEDLAKLKAECKEIVAVFKAKVVASDDPWEGRFAEKFGIVLSGMLLACRLDVAPWTKKHARRCVMRLYKKARVSVVTVEEHAKMLFRDMRAWKRNGQIPRLNEGAKYKGGRKKIIGLQRNHESYGEVIALDPVMMRKYCGSEEKLKGVHRWLIDQKKAPSIMPKQRLQLSTIGISGKDRRRWICLYSPFQRD